MALARPSGPVASGDKFVEVDEDVKDVEIIVRPREPAAAAPPAAQSAANASPQQGTPDAAVVREKICDPPRPC